MFTVDVDYSNHDALHEGVTAIGWVRVIVAAADACEAQLVAAMMVACTHGMPTATYVCI